MRQGVHPDGIAQALKDCAEHYPNGELASFENFTRTGARRQARPDRLAHLRGLARLRLADPPAGLLHLGGAGLARRPAGAGQRPGGQRQLCAIYPLKEELLRRDDTLRLQAQLTYELQAHIDADVRRPRQGLVPDRQRRARRGRSSRQGKLAVVLGVETSEPFGCRQTLDIAQCSRGQIDRAWTSCTRWACAACSCATSSTTRCAASASTPAASERPSMSGSSCRTGTFWQTESCTGPQHDNPIGTAASTSAEAASRRARRPVVLRRRAVQHPRADRARRVRRARHDEAQA